MLYEDMNQTIYRQARKDLKISSLNCNNYFDIKSNVSKELRKVSNIKLINEKSELEIEIIYTELHNIDNFISIRFAFYALVLAIVVLIKGIDLNQYMKQIICGLIFILVSFRYVSDLQKDRILYYKFKLNCIQEILSPK